MILAYQTQTDDGWVVTHCVPCGPPAAEDYAEVHDYDLDHPDVVLTCDRCTTTIND